MADNFVRLIDHRTEFVAFLRAHEPTLRALNGCVHFILGHARSSTSISARIADEYDDHFVFYEDYQAIHAGVANFAGWYDDFLRESLKSHHHVRSHIEDYEFPPSANGVEVYAELSRLGKILISKSSYGPHGDVWWELIQKNTPIYYEYFPDSRYLLTYRSPEYALSSMTLFFISMGKAHLEILDAYIKSMEVFLYIARTFKHVFFLNDSEMEPTAVKKAYRCFLQRGGYPLDYYKVANKRTYDAMQIENMAEIERFDDAWRLYHQLEDIRQLRQAGPELTA